MLLVIGGGADTAYATEFEGPLAGQDITKLIDLINQGEAYENIHIVDFPNGEIRGLELKGS